MKETMVGMLARSLAGHDKGRIYVITAMDDKRITLSDGKSHPMAALKQKNPRHLQIIKNRCHDGAMNDLEIKRTIKLYQMEIQKDM